MTNKLSRRGIAALTSMSGIAALTSMSGIAALTTIGGLAALPAALFAGAAQAQTTTESAFDRVTRTKVLRVAAFPGALPYFAKDIAAGTWVGACTEMSADLAKVFDAKVEYVESTYGNAVLDLQTRSTLPSR